MDSFGDMIPYADPAWYHSWHSPYFNQTHADLRAEIRQWMEDEIMPNVTEWDEANKVPDIVYKTMAIVSFFQFFSASTHTLHTS